MENSTGARLPNNTNTQCNQFRCDGRQPEIAIPPFANYTTSNDNKCETKITRIGKHINDKAQKSNINKKKLPTNRNSHEQPNITITISERQKPNTSTSGQKNKSCTIYNSSTNNTILGPQIMENSPDTARRPNPRKNRQNQDRHCTRQRISNIKSSARKTTATGNVRQVDIIIVDDEINDKEHIENNNDVEITMTHEAVV